MDAVTRILLVEDNPGDARLIVELLRDADVDDVTVETVRRLEDALALAAEQEFHVVLLDLSLPDAHGLETFSRARTHVQDAPIIVLTGDDDEGMALAAVKAGAQDYLVKGTVGADVLVRAIRYAIERQRLLTELQALVRRERENAAKLQSLDEIKNVFLAAVAHDLRSPLTAIYGFAEMLGKRAAELELAGAQRQVGYILRAAEQMRRLLETLLDLERLGGSHSEPRRKPIALPALVEEIVGNLNVDGHELETAVAPVTAAVDPVLVERILENLVLNAANHTPAGTRIWVRVARAREGLEIAVDDEGPGVPDEAKEVVFEAFRRGATPSKARGSGVGLYLVARFSEMHGGRCWVEDRPGGGASFRVLLPAAEVEEAPPQVQERERSRHDLAVDV